MSGVGPGVGFRQRWRFALAALALLVQVLVPQGFMVSADAATPGLVICTGHGPLTLGGQDHPGKAPKSTAGALCALSVHGGAAPPPSLARLDRVALGYAPTIAVRRFDLAPGRGLAAPPPPSQGPPTGLI
jgi:hypothetical protein